MLNIYMKARDLLDRLRSDKDGVVSFEYVIVAALVIAAVGVAYGAGGGFSSALSSGLASLGTKLTAAI